MAGLGTRRSRQRRWLLAEHAMRIAPVITAPTEMQFLNAAQLLMAWDAVDGAATYEVQIATDPGFSSIVDSNDAVATNSFDLSGLDPTDGQHFARVRMSAPRIGEWSAVRSFSLYWLNDKFITDQAAPLMSPRTAEPGPGETEFVGDGWFISDGVAQVPSASSGFTPKIARSSIAREPGVAAYYRIARNKIGTANTLGPFAGWSTAAQAAPNASSHAIMWASVDASSAFVVSSRENSSLNTLEDYSDTEPFYDMVNVLRSAGCFHILDGKLIAISSNSNTTPLVPNAGQTGGFNRHTPKIDEWAVGKMEGVWASDYGLATSYLSGARAESDLFTHTPDSQWLTFTVTTLPSAGSIILDFRRQDSDNKWQIQIDNSGLMSLVEVVANSPSTRVALSSVSNGQRVQCVIKDNLALLTRFQSGAGYTASSRYTSVTTFTTQTEGEIISLGTGGAISDLATFPYYLSDHPEAWRWYNALRGSL